jgi:hypothetical protein
VDAAEAHVTSVIIGAKDEAARRQQAADLALTPEIPSSTG